MADHRKPPGVNTSMSKLFYKSGPLGPTYRKMSIREKIKAFWVTKQMTDETKDVELKIRTTLGELVMTIMFIATMCFMLYGTHDYSMYMLSTSMKRQFIDPKFPTPSEKMISFTEIKSASDVWSYLERHLIDSLFWEYYYHRMDRITKVRAADQHVLLENNLVGRPRIRMVRVKQDSCTIHHSFRRQFSSCYDYFNEASEEKSPIQGDTEENIWFWRPGAGDALTYWGKFAKYGSGGYMHTLPKRYVDAKKEIQRLKDNHWVTRATRAIFVDFTVFNTNVQQFCMSKLVFEFPPTGGAFGRYQFRSAKLYGYTTEYDFFILGVELTFALFVVYFFIEEIREALYFGQRYFTQWPNVYDMIHIVLAGFCAFFIIFKYSTFEPEVNTLLSGRRNKYIDLEAYGFLQNTYFNCAAITLFMAWIKLFKYMQFNRSLAQITNTLRRAALDVSGFVVMFFLIFFAFAELGYLLFGTSVEVFSTFSSSTFGLIRLILGDFDFMQLEEADRVLGPLFFLTYIFFVFFVLLNMFLAILNDTYCAVRSERNIRRPRLTTTKFLSRGLWNICTCYEPPTRQKKDRTISKVTVNEMKQALWRCNFTHTEVNMFLAKYGIDDKKLVNGDDIRKILKDLERKGFEPTKAPQLVYSTDAQDRDARMQMLETVKTERAFQGLTIKDYAKLQGRLDNIESKVGQLAERLIAVVNNLEKVEKSLWSRRRKK